MDRGVPALGETEMSEYQYYEFLAIDRVLTATQQGELRAVSTCGRIVVEFRHRLRVGRSEG
jgi:hypothetical protein